MLLREHQRLRRERLERLAREYNDSPEAVSTSYGGPRAIIGAAAGVLARGGSRTDDELVGVLSVEAAENRPQPKPPKKGPKAPWDLAKPSRKKKPKKTKAAPPFQEDEEDAEDEEDEADEEDAEDADDAEDEEDEEDADDGSDDAAQAAIAASFGFASPRALRQRARSVGKEFRRQTAAPSSDWDRAAQGAGFASARAMADEYVRQSCRGRR
jgi:hypothetical protein